MRTGWTASTFQSIVGLFVVQTALDGTAMDKPKHAIEAEAHAGDRLPAAPTIVVPRSAAIGVVVRVPLRPTSARAELILAFIRSAESTRSSGFVRGFPCVLRGAVMQTSDETTQAEPLRSAIFLDRDGTIIIDKGDLGDPDQVEFLPGVIDTLRDLQSHFVLFIVTNQSAVAAKRLTLAQVNRVNAHVVDRLAQQGIRIEAVFTCPHARTEGCDCIKPKPHFLRIAERLHRLDLRRSFTIGDHPHDVEFARAVGATGIYVLTGHGAKHRADLAEGHIVVPSIVEALPVILGRG